MSDEQARDERQVATAGGPPRRRGQKQKNERKARRATRGEVDMIGDAAERSARVKRHAHAVGFDLVGIAGTSVPEAFARFERQMEAGFGAQMEWLRELPEQRADVRRVWPEARSVVVLGVSYASAEPGYLAAPPAPDEGWIARYAQGRDYHVVVRRMLVNLVRRFEDDDGLGGIPSERHRIFVDTGPVLEKAFAQAAGLGWMGKNTLLIHPGRGADGRAGERGRGSWYFLAVVLTPLELAPDAAETDHCGSCTRCLEACPTGAFPEPYVLDANKCISAWTIESPQPAKVIVAEQLGQHVFGCDLCQEVCPWNRKPTPTRHAPLRPRPENARPKLAELAALDDETFKQRFPRSAVTRVNARQMGEVVGVLRARAAGQSE